MKVYLVGGAVRDHVLGQQIRDRDFVVVGATEQEMLDKGFKKVGADFPVFLHPTTGEEYALARRERKSGHGYNGFEVQYDSSVTLEDDLIRRDLTMNAMAMPVVGLDNDVPIVDFTTIIDPFNGQADIQSGVLRHVSTAFAEDPVRVLRVARFAARYNFMPAKETIELMHNLVQSGELDHLVAERVWSETERALGERDPLAFFTTLSMCGALSRLFPELDYNQRLEYNLAASSHYMNVRERFALLTLDLTPEQLEKFCERVNPPVDFTRLAVRAKKLQLALLNPVTGVSAINTLESIGAFQQTDEALAALKVCQTSIDDLGTSFARRRRRIANILPLVAPIRFADLTSDQQRTLKGPAIGQALRELRVNTVTQFLWREGLGQ